MTLTEWTEADACPGPLAAPAQVAVRLPSLEEVADNWRSISRLLRKATIRTRCFEPIDVLRFTMMGQVCIWVCEVDGKIAAVIVTEVKQYPRKRILEILLCGGSRMRDWIKTAVAVIDQHAQECGCAHIASSGARPGWVRAWGGEATGDIVIVRDLRG
jgi:hypothetical protein